MRLLLQRVKRCSVTIDGTLDIENGLLVLLGIKNGDTESDAHALAKRCVALRIFDDADGKMNRSVREIDGKIMVVSQFTLYGDTRKGNRPSFMDAAPPSVAEPLYNAFVSNLKELLGEDHVATGVFRAMMDVALVNDGPVTILLENKQSP
jgi:D-tyrosyl-tRNA(Tyr) deacylase